MKIHDVTLIVCSFLAVAMVGSSTQAASFRESLQGIVNEAGNHFMPIRGAFDFDLDQYAGSITLPPLTDCSTDTDDGVAEYRCQARGLPDDQVNAERIYRQVVSLVTNCLGKNLKDKRRRIESGVYYDYLPTNDQISIRYSRIVPRSGKRPPYYVVSLRVLFVELNK